MTAVHPLVQALIDPASPVPSDVKAREGVDPATRFAVYRNNIMVSLVDALADTYSVTETMLGTACFRATAREYVLQSWPTSPVLAEYGADFGAFLAGFTPLQSLAYLSDLAALEWARQRSLHAPDGSSLSPQSLAEVCSDAAGMECFTWSIHPAAHVLLSAHPVVSIWAAHQHTDVAQVRSALRGVVDRPEAAWVMRDAQNACVIPVEPGQALFLRALQAGKTMPAALSETLAKGHPVDVVETLALLMRHGVLSAFHTESPR